MKTCSCYAAQHRVPCDSIIGVAVSTRAAGGVAIRLLLLAVLIAATGVVILNQKALGRLRSENQALTAESQEAQRLAAENSTIPQLRQAGEEADRLRRDVESLPGLRNEVRQLRRQADELKKVRSENERLMLEQKAAQSQAASSSMPADFISRATLGDAGLGTPEAAAQTVLWAMCQGNIDRLAQCSLEALPGSQGSNGSSPGRLGLTDQILIDHMKSFPGFRIASRQDISDTEVVLGLQSSVGGTAMPMTLKRVGLEWKLEHW
jgi:hypothetical protein